MVMYYRNPKQKPNMDISVIFSDIVSKISLSYGKNVNYQFGDWSYISSILKDWSASLPLAKKRYPVICLFSPTDEDKTIVNGKTIFYLDLLIAVDTLPDYSNETRRVESFEKILRPIYRLFLQEILKERRIDSGYTLTIEHSYVENYRYGRIGVNGPDGKPFSDKIDAIDIKKMKITLKKQK